ncbi:MAG: regulatory protein RecX [Geminicoccaceae bacterium]
MRSSDRPLDLTTVKDWAFGYVARYASSTARLRRVLLRRARRYGYEDTVSEPLIDKAIATVVELGLIDDAAYARSLERRFDERGRSTRALVSALAEKGVAREIIDDLVGSRSRADEMRSALALARRRRLGPFRRSSDQGDASFELRLKELAVLARAGFDAAIARRIVTASSEDDLHDPDR